MYASRAKGRGRSGLLRLRESPHSIPCSMEETWISGGLQVSVSSQRGNTLHHTKYSAQPREGTGRRV